MIVKKSMSNVRTRSYAGCWTCRKRHRKCTGERPVCQNCKDHRRTCEGYEIRLRWGTGIASRGRLTGASKPTERSTQALQHQSQPSVTEDLICRLPFSYEPRFIPNYMLAASREKETSSQVEYSSINCKPSESKRIDDAQSLFQQCKVFAQPAWLFQCCIPIDNSEFLKVIISGYRCLYSLQSPGNLLVERIVKHCETSPACYSICVALQACLVPEGSARFVEHFDTALKQYRFEIASNELSLSCGTLVAGLLLCSINVSSKRRLSVFSTDSSLPSF